MLIFPPGMVAFFWWAGRKRQELMKGFIQTRLLPGLLSGISPTRRKIRQACLVLAVACAIVALARPQWGFTWQEVRQRGVDIVVAIDTSKSMLAQDVAPNRLARARLAALDLMQLARSDRLGLVAFAGSAFLQCPLTIDDAAFRQSVQTLDVNTIPEGGTALADAIEAALTAFKEGDNHKVLVLMSDGEDHDSGAAEAAKKAAGAGLRIYTIGIGTSEGELLRIKDAQGHDDYIRDDHGNVVKSHLDEGLLQEIATIGGGFYLHLSGAKTIDTLYESPNGLASLPKAEHQEKLVKQYHERFHWPLGAAVVLLIVEMLLPERKRSSASLPLLSSSLALLLLWPGPAAGSPSNALREYKEGNFDQALRDYQQLLERKADDPRLHFNAGTAAYRNRQFEEATNQFSAALNSPDLKLQESAYYNRGNSSYWLGEKNPDPKQRTDAWERSLKDYDLTLKLNPQDADAKFNRDFVKKRLEEFKQQQQQQSKQDKSDQQNQDKQQQQQDPSNDQKQQQEEQQQKERQQAQQNQSQQNSGQQHQQQPADQKKQDEQQQQAAQQAQQRQQQQQPPQQSAGQPKQSEEEKEREAAAYAAGQMTPEQAQQLLDAQKGEELMLPAKPEGKPVDRNRPIKDW
ncbi:MAG TPA: VWA domain-containing protein [Candidatus Acidoferrum sp.]|jgi:Ca-activated chloride channel family protein|nr:VWA domain-containing protein [Candidatus Acidoferrum sp.]